MVIEPGNNTGSNINANSQTSRAKQSATSASKQEATASPANKASDSVSLSPEAQQLARGEAMLESKINQSSDINQEKVDAVRAAIANGQFKIDVQRIAEKILDQDSSF